MTKRSLTKSLFYYALHGIPLAIEFFRRYGWCAMVDRVKFVLWPPKDVRQAIRLAETGDHAAIFGHYYRSNIWGSFESRSGGGSTLASTESIRYHLPLIFQRFGIRRILDAPCGDFYWMRLVDISGRSYVGIDVVPEMIEQNVKVYGAPERQFRVANIVRDQLPAADLMICRDCLQHLSYDDIRSLLRNFVNSGTSYLLATTFDDVADPYDIDPGHFRHLGACLRIYCFRGLESDSIPGYEQDLSRLEPGSGSSAAAVGARLRGAGAFVPLHYRFGERGT